MRRRVQRYTNNSPAAPKFRKISRPQKPPEFRRKFRETLVSPYRWVPRARSAILPVRQGGSRGGSDTCLLRACDGACEPQGRCVYWRCRRVVSRVPLPPKTVWRRGQNKFGGRRQAGYLTQLWRQQRRRSSQPLTATVLLRWTGASVNLGHTLVPSARCGVPYSTRQDADAAAGAKAQNMAGLPELVFAHPDQKEFQRRVAALLEK